MEAPNDATLSSLLVLVHTQVAVLDSLGTLPVFKAGRTPAIRRRIAVSRDNSQGPITVAFTTVLAQLLLITCERHFVFL